MGDLGHRGHPAQGLEGGASTEEFEGVLGDGRASLRKLRHLAPRGLLGPRRGRRIVFPPKKFFHRKCVAPKIVFRRKTVRPKKCSAKKFSCEKFSVERFLGRHIFRPKNKAILKTGTFQDSYWKLWLIQRIRKHHENLQSDGTGAAS